MRQAEHLSPPEYVVTDERGRPHDKTYTVEVRLDGVSGGVGVGKTKKEAQQAAAEAALEPAPRLSTEAGILP